MSSLSLRSSNYSGQKLTSKLLEKVSKQLKGDFRSKTSGSADSDGSDDDEGGVASYLKLLSQKATQQSQSGDAQTSEDDSDEDKKSRKKPAVTKTNRFLKTSPTPAAAAASEGKKKNDAVTQNVSRASANQNRSPAFQKVEAFTKKYGRIGKTAGQRSDSDVELNLSMDEEVLADVREMKKQKQLSSSGSYGLTNSASKIQQNAQLKNVAKKSSAVSDDEEDDESSSMKIGKSGNKFLKKSSVPSAQESFEKHDVASRETKSTKSPRKDKQNRSVFKFEDGGRQATEVILDSEEESLAEFIGGLSAGSNNSRTSKPTSKDVVSTKVKSSLSDNDVSIRSNRNNDKSKSGDTSDGVGFILRDIESLEAVIETSSSNQEKKNKKNLKSGQQQQSDSSGDVFRELGLQSVDELLGLNKVETVEPLPVSEIIYESDFDAVPSTSRGVSPMPLRSILSPTPRSMTPRSSRSRVRLMDELIEIRSRSPSPETPRSASRVSIAAKSETIHTITDSESEIEQSIQTIDSQGSDNEENSTVKMFSDASSVSSFDRMSVTRRSRRRFSRTSASSRRSSTASERYYSDDFTRTESQSTSRRSSYSDEQESSESRTPRRAARAANTTDCAVQTGLDVGLHYHWVHNPVREAWTSAQYQEAFAKPASIATSVITPDSLHALTNFSPATLAINDLIRQQMHLMNHLMTIQRRLHNNVIQSLDSSSYRYTTLKDTKEYIKNHSKPVVSFEEALSQVKEEMGLA